MRRIYCSGCNEVIQIDEEVFAALNGDILHVDLDCVQKYFNLRVMDADIAAITLEREEAEI